MKKSKKEHSRPSAGEKGCSKSINHPPPRLNTARPIRNTVRRRSHCASSTHRVNQYIIQDNKRVVLRIPRALRVGGGRADAPEGLAGLGLGQLAEQPAEAAEAAVLEREVRVEADEAHGALPPTPARVAAAAGAAAVAVVASARARPASRPPAVALALPPPTLVAGDGGVGLARQERGGGVGVELAGRGGGG